MSDNFLVVMIRKVIDTPADPTAVPPVQEVSHDEVERVYIEDSATQVAINVEAGLAMDVYQVQFNGAQLQATLHPVTVKGGPRASAPNREVVEIEANGTVIGSAVVEV